MMHLPALLSAPICHRWLSLRITTSHMLKAEYQSPGQASQATHKRSSGHVSLDFAGSGLQNQARARKQNTRSCLPLVGQAVIRDA
jgi:hypothetical protein